MRTIAEETRDQIRDQTAYLALIDCQAMGCEVEFQDRAQKRFVKLWAIPGPEATRLSDDGELQEEITEKTFDIPRQYGCSCGQCNCACSGIYTGHNEIVLFPPDTGVSVNAIVKFEGRDYSAVRPEADSLRAKYKLHCEYHKPRGTSKI